MAIAFPRGEVDRMHGSEFNSYWTFQHSTRASQALGERSQCHCRADSTSVRLWNARVAHLDISSFPHAAVNVVR